MRTILTVEEAQAFLASSDFVWHQRFELAPGVVTPGTSNVGLLLDLAGVPTALSGLSVLDLGTSNGGTAFEVERRGAARVVAVDIYPPDWFGFTRIKQALNSQVEFLQASVYELPDRLHEQFDLVLFFGVLYHLRHPLLALDRVRELVRTDIAIETAICDYEDPALSRLSCARFYRRAELGNDGSNWFAPSMAGLLDWVASCGFDVTKSSAWPEGAASRALVRARRLPDPPEYTLLSYERPIVGLRTKDS
jgi:tRNA (mo5U34)-methyltransferase